MMMAERMRELNDPWVTEYRGQFNYAIPQNEIQSFIYDYDNSYPHPHPSARLPNGKIAAMPPQPTGFVSSNGQMYNESGHPYNPPPPPARKRMTKKKGVQAGKGDVGKEKAKPARKPITFNNVTVPDSPKFQTTRTANRHIVNCDLQAPAIVAQKEPSYAANKVNPTRKEILEQNKRLYHPLNYDRQKYVQNAPKNRNYSIREVEPSPHVPPTPYPPPIPPPYSPFSTQSTLPNVREVEPSPHYIPPPPPLPHAREATPSPRESLHPSRHYNVREMEISPHGPSPPSKPPVAWEVPGSPQGGHATPPPPPPLPPASDVVKKNNYMHIDAPEVRSIVPPLAFSRNPNDKTTIPAHTCSHRWHNDSELYWSNLPYRESPPLECAMCFARPQPNEYTKSFDPSRWLELNPKFYKYMPAQSMRSIPAAGKVVRRGPSFSLSSMYG